MSHEQYVIVYYASGTRPLRKYFDNFISAIAAWNRMIADPRMGAVSLTQEILLRTNQ